MASRFAREAFAWASALRISSIVGMRVSSDANSLHPRFRPILRILQIRHQFGQVRQIEIRIGGASTKCVFISKKEAAKMSLYRVVRLIGSSSTSWEEAAKSALEEAAKHLEDLRVAEVEQLDIRMKENKVVEYRARVRASFRYHPEKH
jgi:flavin-binding protein dodecin